MKEFILDAIRQCLGWSKPHTGKLVTSNNARGKLLEYGLGMDTLRDTFRYGEHQQLSAGVEMFEVIRGYQNYSVGMWYLVKYTNPHKYVEQEKYYLVVTCWKRDNW